MLHHFLHFDMAVVVPEWESWSESWSVRQKAMPLGHWLGLRSAGASAEAPEHLSANQWSWLEQWW